jgi:hypothetical protein
VMAILSPCSFATSMTCSINFLPRP